MNNTFIVSDLLRSLAISDGRLLLTLRQTEYRKGTINRTLPGKRENKKRPEAVRAAEINYFSVSAMLGNLLRVSCRAPAIH